MGITNSKQFHYSPDSEYGAYKVYELRKWYVNCICLKFTITNMPLIGIERRKPPDLRRVQAWVNEHRSNFEEYVYEYKEMEPEDVGKYGTDDDPRQSDSYTGLRSFASTNWIFQSEEDIRKAEGKMPNVIAPDMYGDDNYFEIEKVRLTHDWVAEHSHVFETQTYARTKREHKNTGKYGTELDPRSKKGKKGKNGKARGKTRRKLPPLPPVKI